MLHLDLGGGPPAPAGAGSSGASSGSAEADSGTMAIAALADADAAMPQAALGSDMRPGSYGGSQDGMGMAAPTVLVPTHEKVLDPWADMGELPSRVTSSEPDLALPARATTGAGAASGCATPGTSKDVDAATTTSS